MWFLARSSEHLLYCDDGSPVLPPEAPLNWGEGGEADRSGGDGERREAFLSTDTA